MEAETDSHSRNCTVHLLVVLFGLGSFVALSGLYVELPILVNNLPEAWQLSSYIVILSQLANLGPIIYSAARKIWSQKMLEIPLIHSSLALVTLSCVLLSIFWDYTTIVFGHMHSTVFLVLTFLISCVDYNSTFLYLPFIANFKEQYVVSYMIGTSLTGPLPGFLAMAQGVGGQADCRNVYVTMNSTSNVTEYVVEAYYSPPRFSANVFYACVCGQMVISWIAFHLLNTLPIAKRERVSLMPVTRSSNPVLIENSTSCIDQTFSTGSEKTTSPETNLLGKSFLSKSQSYLLYIIIGLISLFHDGVLHSVQTYSVLPYGNLAFQMTVILPRIGNPLCCFVAMFISITNVKAVVGLAVFISGLAVYMMALALLSPNPPLVGSQFGAILVVLVSVVETGAVSFIKATIVFILRRNGGQEALFKFGVVTQVGSVVGAIIIFAVLQLTDIFQSITPCS